MIRLRGSYRLKLLSGYIFDKDLGDVSTGVNKNFRVTFVQTQRASHPFLLRSISSFTESVA